MNEQTLLSHPAKVLTNVQRQQYFDVGYLLLPGFLSQQAVAELVETANQFVEESRYCKKSNDKFDLEPSHCEEAPRLRRLSFPVAHHEKFRTLAFDSSIVDLAEDLLGPDVCYHHSKLNYKWSGGGEEIKWHQDIQYWPHTDYSPLTIGIYLEDVDDEMGPMGIVPKSHKGPLYDLRDKSGKWTGAIRDEEIGEANIGSADFLTGPAGSVTVHNCCSIHGSLPNNSPRPRPLLLQTYTAGNSFPLQTVGANGLGADANTMVRGSRPALFNIAGRDVPVAPDWSAGYSSIIDVQQSASEK